MDVHARCPQRRGCICETAQQNHVDVPKVNWLGFPVSQRFLGTTRAKTLCNLFICSHIHILLITVLFPGPCTCTILQYLSPKLQTAIAHSILNRFLSFLECGLAFI